MRRTGLNQQGIRRIEEKFLKAQDLMSQVASELEFSGESELFSLGGGLERVGFPVAVYDVDAVTDGSQKDVSSDEEME